MRIEEYFLTLEQLINNLTGTVSFDITKDKRSEHTGFFKVQIQFRDGKVLHVREFIQIKKSAVTRMMYAYHLQDSGGNLIFRYDNTMHHPDIPTFPHHKHRPLIVETSEAPELETVLKEVQMLLDFSRN